MKWKLTIYTSSITIKFVTKQNSSQGCLQTIYLGKYCNKPNWLKLEIIFVIWFENFCTHNIRPKNLFYDLCLLYFLLLFKWLAWNFAFKPHERQFDWIVSFLPNFMCFILRAFCVQLLAKILGLCFLKLDPQKEPPNASP